MRFSKLSPYSRYANIVKMLVFVGVLAAILNIAPTQPAKADDVGYDLFPWINTYYLNTLKRPQTYTIPEAEYVADHFDEASAQLWQRNDVIKQRNPHIQLYVFLGLATLNCWPPIDQYLSEFSGHTNQEIESTYIHYKCDVSLHDTIIPGCNLIDIQTGQCSGSPAEGCGASSALTLSESRVPVPDYAYFTRGWYLPNFTSQLYKDYGVWAARENLQLHGSINPVTGMWWDNILYLGSYAIDDTIEYWGYPDTNLDHPRNDDYHLYFEEIKQRVEQEEGRSLVWYGNVNNMWWIRDGAPHIDWVLDHVDHASPESWVSPLNSGEYSMPFWNLDCVSIKESWDYTVNRGLNLSVLTYNAPFEGAYENPDQRTKIFSIAKYYLVNNERLFYGYHEDEKATDLFTSQWNPMAEINIGKPRTNPAGVKDFEGITGTNKFFDWNNQTTQPNCTYYNWSNVVVARHYDNGLIIARWKGQRWQTGTPPADDPAYNSYVDPREYSLANPYHNEYYVVGSDGTLSDTPVPSVTLRTNEAVMLLQVCGDGVASSTCGCNGEILDSGDICSMNSLNQPPELTPINSKTIHEQEILTFNVLASDDDPEDTLALSASNLPEGATFTDNGGGSGTFSWTPTDQQASTYPNIHFEVTDGTDTDTEDITITVLDGVADCTPAWECSNWSVCTDSLQTRSCDDHNLCGSDAGRPVETAPCDSTAPGVVTNLVAN